MSIDYTYSSETRDAIITALEAALATCNKSDLYMPRLEGLVTAALEAMDAADAFDYEKESA